MSTKYVNITTIHGKSVYINPAEITRMEDSTSIQPGVASTAFVIYLSDGGYYVLEGTVIDFIDRTGVIGRA